MRWIDGPALYLLWRHVAGCAKPCAELGESRVLHRRPRNTEVEDLEPAGLPVDDQVRRLDIPVDDAALVRVCEAIAQLLDEFEAAAQVQRLLTRDFLAGVFRLGSTPWR